MVFIPHFRALKASIISHSTLSSIRSRKLTVDQAPPSRKPCILPPIDRPQPRYSPQIMRPVVSLLLPPLLLNHLPLVDIVPCPFIRHVLVEEDRLVDVRMFF